MLNQQLLFWLCLIVVIVLCIGTIIFVIYREKYSYMSLSKLGEIKRGRHTLLDAMAMANKRNELNRAGAGGGKYDGHAYLDAGRRPRAVGQTYY
jgi:hypothetical protein